MSERREALMVITNDLLESLIGKEKLIGLLNIGLSDFSWLATALKLPPYAKITGVSGRLDRDVTDIRIACPDFVETIVGNLMPQVEAVYDQNGFVRWGGPAVGESELPFADLAEPESWQTPAKPVTFREFL